MKLLENMQGILYSRDGQVHLFSQPGEGMQWQLRRTEGVTACYVEALCEEGFDADCALVLRPSLDTPMADFTAIYNHSKFWCMPVFGTDLRQLPESRVQSLLIRRGALWHYYLPVCDDTYKTVIRSCETGFEFYSYTGCDDLTVCAGQLAFVCAQGEDPFEVMHRCARAAAKLLDNGLRMRAERAMPQALEYFGWCSWDALQIRVSHEGLLEKAKEFRDKQVPVHFAIIDDMWADVPALNKVPQDTPFWDMVHAMHASKLRSFQGDPKRFPKGMAAAISDLKAMGIPEVGVWFPVTGYWDGMDPEGEAQALMAYLDYVPFKNRLLVKPEADKALALYDIFCSRIRSWGGDFVKIDNQGCHTQYQGVKPVGQTARAIQTALDSAADANFGGALINCMGMPSECMFNRRSSPVSRCSDDFMPESREWFSKNILQCAYNGTLQGQYYINDWDMWWTDDDQAAKNSLCRAISGGPIYVSDKLGRTRTQVLKPLMFDDGRILRCDDSATPTADCLIGDPTQAERVFKLRNRIDSAGVVAAFNIHHENHAVSGTVSPADAGIMGRCVCYEHFTRNCRILEAGECLPVPLQDNDEFRLYTFVPVAADGITPLGRTDKFMGLRAITAQAGNTVTLYEGGSVSFVCEADVQVFAGGQELPVCREGILHTVQADRDQRVLTVVKK